MSRPRHDIYRTLTVVTIAFVAMFNPISLGFGTAQGSTPTSLIMAPPSAAGIVTTEHLNFTQANVNASRSFKESSWNSNSTTAKISVNSTDQEGEKVSAVLQLDQRSLAGAQSIRYDFDLATQVSQPGSSGPRITASFSLTSSNYGGWYSQSATPIYPDNTKTVGVMNVQGHYANGTTETSLFFEAQNVTNAQASSYGGTNTTLFQREFAGYVGDGVSHHYSIEIDLQSGRTVWIVDDAIISSFNLSFVPDNLVFAVSGTDPGNFAVAMLKDPVETVVLSSQTIVLTTTQSSGVVVYGLSGSSSFQIVNVTRTLGQISSLQDQINHLNDQVGNLTSANSQLQDRNSQWWSQWWASIVWGLLGVGIGGVFIMTAPGLKTRRKSTDALSNEDGSACPQCGGRMPAGATFCGECGTQLRETASLCEQCGGRMPPASVYCGECGTAIETRPPPGQASQASAMEGRDEKEGPRR